MHLRLLRHELCQDPAEAQGVLAQRRSHPVVAGGRRVALVEYEVDHLEHRGQTGGEVHSAGNLEGDARRRERALGPDDALRDGGFRDQEGPRDLVGREAAEQTERERGAGLGREHRMTGREHEAQEIVADVIVERGGQLPLGTLLAGFELVPELGVLALEQLAAAQDIDGAMLRRGHEPGAGVVRDS